MEKENILLVEGPNDGSMISGLLYKHAVVVPDSKIISCVGLENLLTKLDLYLKNSSAYTALGIVVDADKSVDTRWQQLRDRLWNTGKYSCKKTSLNEEGIILEPIDPEDAKVGVWIMPNNKCQGALEDFLLDMIPKEDELLKKVERELIQLENENLHRYKDKCRNKAKVHTFLSWNEKPGCSLNTAIVSRLLNPNTELSDVFVQWIKKLYLC